MSFINYTGTDTSTVMDESTYSIDFASQYRDTAINGTIVLTPEQVKMLREYVGFKETNWRKRLE